MSLAPTCPEYRFSFAGGIVQRGTITRISRSATDDILETRPWRYSLNDAPLVSGLNIRMPAVVADLLDVCVAMYTADRLAPRSVPHDTRSPEARGLRRIYIDIPLRHPDRWRAPAVKSSLEKLAFQVSEDDWHFRFSRRESAPRSAESQGYLFPEVERDQTIVALNSGGMDSLLGILAALRSPESESVTTVSVITHGRMARLINQISNDLSSAGGDPLKPLYQRGLEVNLRGQGRHREDRESSQRMRGLLFLGAGTAAAIVEGNDRLQIMENGPGAINLSATPYQHRGYWANRATHPATLDGFVRLVSLLLDRDFRVVNDGLWHTKGELVASLYEDRFANAFRHTVSCERFPYTTAKVACGKCAGCLHRMIALHAAQRMHLEEKRYADLEGKEIPDPLWTAYCSLEGSALRTLAASMRDAFRSSAGLTESDFAPELDDIIDLAPAFGMAPSDVHAQLVRMLRAHHEEVASFLEYAGRVARWDSAMKQRLTSDDLPMAS